MKQRIPTQFLQINLARSDEIKNWAERLVKMSNWNHDLTPRLMPPPIGNRGGAAAKPPDEALPDGFAQAWAPPLQSAAQASPLGSAGSPPAPPVTTNQRLLIGEVKKADTLNYRTLKPERDGLFCERIFGPTADWICACGQTKERGAAPGGGLRATDHERALRGELPVRTCPLCGVEATTSRFRRYRMGYIGLACPVTHIWYLNSRPNLFALLLKMPTKYIKKIVYYKAYSPSLGRPECLSPCLSPGGDFFDNEWEYLHRWLAGKSSSHDILASWNFVQANAGYRPVRSIQNEAAAELRSAKTNTYGRAQRRQEPSGAQASPQQSRGETRAQASPRLSRGEAYACATEAHAQSLGAKPTSRGEARATGHDGATILRSGDVGQSWQSVAEASAPSSEALLQTRGEARPQAWAPPLQSRGEACAQASPLQNPRYAPTQWLAAHPLHSFTMPEFPNWLENTGAQALVNQLKTKNWSAEILKIENSLLQSGSGASQSRGEARVTLSEAPLQEAEPTLPSGELPLPSAGVGSAPAERSYALQSPRLRPGTFDDKKRKMRLRQLKLLKTFQKSGFPTTQMIFSNLPVLPPELRPIIQLGGGQLASSDVNDLYRRVISRNNRLKYYLYETHFVEFLVRSEQQLVQLAVDALLENGKTTQVRHTSGQKRLYRSLTDRIGGKQGRFRMNLLGKRVDYSGRSVIVVGPSLDISNCGLPYEMASELFQPFLLRHLLELNVCKTIRAAKNILRLNKAFARQCMHGILGSHPILLNRAPTLHRLGIQAFHPILVFGRAIHLHPLVCPAFNADFDGDQMAVHIPLSPSARMEARLLMLASGNWLSASTGQPNLLPSQDMVLGFYYVTLEKPGFQKGKGKVYQNLTDAVQDYESGDLDLHSQIWVYLGRSYLQERHCSRALPSQDPLQSGAQAPQSGAQASPLPLGQKVPAPLRKLRWTTKKAQVQLSADILSRKNISRSHHEVARKSKQRLEVEVQSSTGQEIFGGLRAFCSSAEANPARSSAAKEESSFEKTSRPRPSLLQASTAERKLRAGVRSAPAEPRRSLRAGVGSAPTEPRRSLRAGFASGGLHKGKGGTYAPGKPAPNQRKDPPITIRVG